MTALGAGPAEPAVATTAPGPPWPGPVLEKRCFGGSPRRSGSGARGRAAQSGFDRRQRRRKCLIGIERRSIKQKRVGSRLERRHRSLTVTRVSLLQVL